MVDSSPQQEIGSAMWGGLRPDEAGERRRLTSATPEDESTPVTDPRRPLVRALLSVFLTAFGLAVFLTGLGIMLGVAGVLIGAGLAVLTVGLMLGMGES